MSPTKTVLITTLFPPGGGGAAVVHHQLCKQLGGEACALVPAVEEVQASRFDGEQLFPIHRLPFLAAKQTQTGPKWWRALWNVAGKQLLSRIPLAFLLLRHLRRLRPEVVCIGGLRRLYWVHSLVRWATRAMVVFHIHGEEVSEPDRRSPISRWLHRLSIAALKKSDAVISTSVRTPVRLGVMGLA